MWLDPTRTGQNLVLRLPWPPDIVDNLISATNPQGKITNSDLELATLILQEATLLEAVPQASMAAPRQVLQAPDGKTGERIGFSGMGGDCNGPLPGWSSRHLKTG